MKTLPLRGSLGVLTKGGVVSPACRSRQSSTRCTPMLSRAHPVMAIEPARTVASPTGVSTTPNGGETAAVDGTTVIVTLIGPAVLAAPTNVTVTLPACDAARPAANRVEIVKVAGPLPDDGETASHGVVA